MEALLMPPKAKVVRWYQEPWLLLVAGGPLLVIIACLYTIVIAYRSSDKVIAPDYYKQGLAINMDIHRDGVAHSRRIAGDMRIDPASGIVHLQIEGDGKMPAGLGLVVAEAGSGEFEKINRVLLTRKDGSNYEGEFAAPGALKLADHALWHVKVEAGDWRLTADWPDPAHTALRLKAAN